ncbi:hypothetical protein ACFL0T_08890, partial [Candidatus Omnitrophota bacterium]
EPAGSLAQRDGKYFENGEKGLKLPVYPTKREGWWGNAVHGLWWTGVIGSAVAILSFAFLSIGTVGVGAWIFGTLFNVFVFWFFATNTRKLLPYLRFYADLVGGLLTIYKNRDNYHGPLTPEQLREKEHFFKIYFRYVGSFAALLVGMGLFYGFTAIPWFGWIPAILILILTIRESIRAFWYIFIESAATSIERNQRLSTLKLYGSIGRPELDQVRNNAYLRDVFKDVLLKATLKEFHLVSADELSALEDAIDDPNVNRLPDIRDPQAMEEVLRWFNKVVMFEPGEFEDIFDKTDLAALPPAIFKGTGKKRVVPTVEFLDAEDKETMKSKAKITGQLPTSLIRSGFQVFKETFSHSWHIFLDEDLLGTLPYNTRDTWYTDL